MLVSPVLISLTSHRWNVPVVAHLGEREDARFNELVRDLSVSRDSLIRSLAALHRPGWIEHKGPVYSLTPPGRVLAPPCAEILGTARRTALEAVFFKKWSLPVAAALENWSLRFSELRAMLPGISPRALTLALKEMQAAGLVHRKVIGGFPPSTSYRLTPAGQACLPALAKLSAAG